MDEKTRHWNEKYATGTPPWDRHGTSPALHAWLSDGTLKPCRILVPGCGRGHEVVELAQAGFDVTGLDIAPLALEHLTGELAQAGLTASLVCADVLQWQPQAPFDAIYEQTCLCALHTHEWPAYVDRLHGWLRPGGLLCALFMQTGRPGGPPYHCGLPDMRTLFGPDRWLWPGEAPRSIPHHPGQYEYAMVLKRR